MSIRELNVCPPEFQDRIADVGGDNRYGEPNFRLIWSQSVTSRAGGFWAGGGQLTYRGYRDIPLGLDPCWVLQQWYPPEKYGTPESYYVSNYDDESGLQTLGEYPYTGRYETVIPLVWRGLVNGRIVTEHLPISSFLFDMVVPIIKNAEAISFAKKRILMQEAKEREDAQQVSQIESRLADAFPAFGSASRSGARLSCNSVVQKKAEAIERHWRSAASMLLKRGKGLSQKEYHSGETYPRREYR